MANSIKNAEPKVYGKPIFGPRKFSWTYAVKYFQELATCEEEEVAMARQEWREAGSPPDNEWSIDMTISNILDNARSDWYCKWYGRRLSPLDEYMLELLEYVL